MKSSTTIWSLFASVVLLCDTAAAQRSAPHVSTKQLIADFLSDSSAGYCEV